MLGCCCRCPERAAAGLLESTDVQHCEGEDGRLGTYTGFRVAGLRAPCASQLQGPGKVA